MQRLIRPSLIAMIARRYSLVSRKSLFSYFLYFQWICSHMFLDLESQEVVNRQQSFRIAGRDLNQSAAISLYVFVADFPFEFLHHFASRRSLLVNQHRHLEVPLAEHHPDVP